MYLSQRKARVGHREECISFGGVKSCYSFATSPSTPFPYPPVPGVESVPCVRDGEAGAALQYHVHDVGGDAAKVPSPHAGLYGGSHTQPVA